MTWFKVDDTFAFHRKVVAAGLPALGLWVRAGAWCAQTLTDGVVPEHMVSALSDGQPELAQCLVRAGLWHPVKGGGFAFHQWAEYQPTRASVEHKRAVRAAAGRIGGTRSGQVRAATASKNEARGSSKNEAARSTLSNPRPVGSGVVSSKGLGSVGGTDFKEDLKKDSKEDNNKTYVGKVVTSAAPEKKPRRSTTSPGTRLPDDFAVTPAMVDWARQRTPAVDGRTETENFIDFWQAKAGKDALKRDWTAAWRYWMRNAQTRTSNGKTRYRGADLNIAEFEALKDPPLHALPRATRKAS